MYDINQIKELIPHRYPFLMIDRVIEVEEEKRIIGIKNITANEPFFQGHFPGLPIMPGVLIIECMAQLAAILAVLTVKKEEGKKIIPLFRGIDKAKFRKKVQPGDRLDITLTVLKRRNTLWSLGGEAHVEGVLAAEAEIKAILQNN